MRDYVRLSRLLVAAVLSVTVGFDLAPGMPQPGHAADAAAAPATRVSVVARGGARPPSLAPPGTDVLAVRPQAAVSSPTPTPASTPDPHGFSSSAHAKGLVLKPLGEFRVTGYSDSPHNGTDGRGITRSGQPTRWGVVAVDPRVIPLGSDLLIEGMEETIFTALDTGGGVVGRWLDVWYPTDREALQHGVRLLNVYLVASASPR